MLIQPLSSLRLVWYKRYAQSALVISIVLMFASALAWVGVRFQMHEWALQDTTTAAPSQVQPSDAIAPLINTSPTEAISASDVVAQWSAEALKGGIELISVRIDESASQSPDASTPDSLAQWRTSLSLRGSYPAIKLFMQQMADRHQQVTWTSLQWRRGNETSAPSTEVQLDTVWLNRPRAVDPVDNPLPIRSQAPSAAQ